MVLFMSEEILIGGVYSANLKKGILRGYGLYVTNRRIIGVKSKKSISILMGGAMGGLIGRALVDKLSRDESKKAIDEIESKKDFDLLLEDVSKVEIKKPSFFKVGYIKIKSRNGDEMDIIIRNKKDYGLLSDIFKKAIPDRVVVID